MDAHIFFIRSVAVQNLIMAVVVAVLVGLLVYFIKERLFRHCMAVVIWAFIALWFFNSPYWGFSAVAVSPEGLQIKYGFLSVFKNSTLAPDTPWKIRVYMGGIRRIQKLYYIELGPHTSMKVRGPDAFKTLESLGAAIDGLNGKPMGRVVERPVNL